MRVLGDIFGLRGFFTWHLVMAILMCAVWLILFCLTAWAFARGEIFMAKPEDVIQDSVIADRAPKAPSPSPSSSSHSGRSSFATEHERERGEGRLQGARAYDKEARGMGQEQV